MFSQPTAEHQWLERFLGKWTFETSCDMGPGQAPMVSTGEEEYVALGKLWVIGSGMSAMPDGAPAFNQTTIGYNPTKKLFVGAFITSVMDYLWPYEGAIDEARTKISLRSVGPSFGAHGGSMADYLDVYEFQDDSHRTLTSFQAQPDGTWHQFMQAKYIRVLR